MVYDVLRGSVKMEVEQGYVLVPCGGERNVMYFLVDWKYMECPLFIGPIGKYLRDGKSKFGKAHAEFRKHVRSFFVMLWKQ